MEGLSDCVLVRIKATQAPATIPTHVLRKISNPMTRFGLTSTAGASCMILLGTLFATGWIFKDISEFEDQFLKDLEEFKKLQNKTKHVWDELIEPDHSRRTRSAQSNKHSSRRRITSGARITRRRM
uniref:Col_cuticle_N domain-containing protein n=1 Tax=Heterorhabditis bacteriophora TaxID=37862 RepID=A0A1I7X9D8_HETBA